MKNAFYTFVGVVFILGCFILFLNKPAKHFQIIKIGQKSIMAEVVDTPASRELGLSGRKSLADSSGMLFVFEEPGIYGFWMKDMNFPLDMIWINDNKQVVSISKDVAPETFPQVFEPVEAVKYVLEVPAGFSDKEGIDMGALVSFE